MTNPVFEQNSLELITNFDNNNETKNHLSIPQEVWIAVFKQLDFASWRECRYLDRAFHQICFNENVTSYLLENDMIPQNKKMILGFAKHLGPLLAKLNLDNIDLTEEEWRDLFNHCPHIRELSIKQDILRKNRDFKPTYSFLEYLPTTLLSLNLAHCKITNKNLEHLIRLSALQSLNLSGCVAIIDKGVKHLKTLSDLQFLDLHGCRITNKGLEHLTSLPALRSLNLSHCCRITDHGLKHLKVLSALQFLNLSRCFLITDHGLEKLKIGMVQKVKFLDNN